MARTASRRNQAQKHKRGLQYTIEVYVPIGYQGNGESKKAFIKRLKADVRRGFEELDDRIRRRNGIVRIFSDV